MGTASELDIPRIVATAALLLPIVLLAVGALFYLRSKSGFHYQRGGQIHITDAALHLDGDRWGGPVALRDLDLMQARVLGSDDSRDWQPRWRSWGVHTPWLRSGWFRLRNGHRALLFVPDEYAWVLIPTTRDYVVIVAVPEAERWLADLRARVAAVDPASAPRRTVAG